MSIAFYDDKGKETGSLFSYDPDMDDDYSDIVLSLDEDIVGFFGTKMQGWVQIHGFTKVTNI